MLKLAQARRTFAPGTRPIVVARDLASAHAALREAGINPDDSRAVTAILTPIHAPLSHVLSARPETAPILDAFPWDDVDPGRFLTATLDHLKCRGYEVSGGREGREGDTGDKSERGPREAPKPKPAPPAPAPSTDAIAA